MLFCLVRAGCSMAGPCDCVRSCIRWRNWCGVCVLVLGVGWRGDVPVLGCFVCGVTDFC